MIIFDLYLRISVPYLLSFRMIHTQYRGTVSAYSLRYRVPCTVRYHPSYFSLHAIALNIAICSFNSFKNAPASARSFSVLNFDSWVALAMRSGSSS